jgi:hypothetical protein
MAAVNGFTATAPDTRYGDADYVNVPTWADAQKFQAGGSGTQELSEIGGYLATAGAGNVAAKIAVFEDDAANGCPGAMVANSEGSLTITNALYELKTHTYSTKPQVTGGSYYWIAVISDVNRASSVFTTGGTSLERGSVTYPTWPSGDDWHTHSDLTKDYSFYAVYKAVSTAQFARPSSDVAGGTFRSIVTTAPFGPRVIA